MKRSLALHKAIAPDYLSYNVAFLVSARFVLIIKLETKHDLQGDANMTETAEKLKVELSRLSMQDRAELAYFLIHSLDEDVDDDAEIAWDAELERRMQEITKGTASSEPSSKVFAQLREKYS
jgi:putative addiction module component (TIGR02574 family)